MGNNMITELDEQRIDELLAYTTEYSERNAENIKRQFMQKTAKKLGVHKRFLLAAAIAAVTVALSGIALAATGFDLGALYNSIFQSEEAAPYVQAGEGITILHNEGDLSVEPLAAFLVPADGDGGLFLELQIRDLAGAGRLDDSLAFLWDNGYIDDLQLNTGEAQISVVDENTVVAGLYINPHRVGRIVRIDKIVSGDTIFTGSWEFAISSDNALEQRKFYGAFEGNRTEVTLRGMGIEFRIYADYTSDEFPYSSFPHDYKTDGTVLIHLSDGTTVQPMLSSLSCDNTPVAVFSYSTGFVNPADVVSVTFCGTTISGETAG